MLKNEIVVDLVSWSQALWERDGAPQHAPEYVKRDGVRRQREYDNFENGPDNIFCPQLIGAVV